MPVIAFSTDANVAAPGVYLLSFLPESDVDRIVQYAASVGKRSFAALIPDNPYGSVVEAAFRQEVARRGGQIVALEHYPHDKAAMAAPVNGRAGRDSRRCAVSFRTAATPCRTWRRRWSPTASTPRRSSSRHRPVGRSPGLLDAGARRRLVCGAGCRRISQFRRPLRRALQTGSGADRDARLRCGRACRRAGEDAGPQRFSPQVLTNPSGFTGIDGLFRFRPTAPTNADWRCCGHAVGTAGHLARAASFGASAADKLHAARSATTASSTGKPGR